MNAPMKAPPLQQDIFGTVSDRAFPAPAELLHVSIAHTGPGIDELIRFYQVVLNMRFVFKFSYPAFEFIALSHDDENHRIGILNNLMQNQDALSLEQGVKLDEELTAAPSAGEPRHAPLRECRIEHLSWGYRKFEDVIYTAKRVYDELGIWPRTSRLQGFDVTIDYNDPDGNRVELVSISRSQAQILHGLEKLFSSGNAEKQQYNDIYQPFNMEKMIGLLEGGEHVDNLTNKEWVKARVAEGVL